MQTFKRILLIFPLLFLAVAFGGLLARPSDFVFPYSFWEEAGKTLKRFGEVWIFLGLFLIFLRKKAPVQNFFQSLARIDRTRFLLVILPLALVLRVIWCFLTNYVPSGDASWFMNTAWGIYLGKGVSIDGVPTAAASPGYPYFLSFLYRFVGRNLKAIQIIQSFMDVATLFFVFLFAEITLGKVVAYLTTFYLAFSINQILIAPLIINEHLYLLLVFPALYLLARELEKPSWVKLLSAAVLIGLSDVTRGILILFPPTLFFLYLFSGRGWKQSFLKSLAVTLVSVAVILPWTYRNYKVMGYPVPVCTSAGFGFYTMNSPIADPYVTQLVELKVVHPEYRQFHPNDEVARYIAGSRYAKEWILSDPWRFTRLGAGKLISLFGIRSYWTLYDNLLKYGESRKGKIMEKIFKKPMIYGYILHFSLFIVGCFILLSRYGWNNFDAKKMLILLIIYFSVGIHFLYCGEKRYRLPIEPFIYMTSAFTLLYLVRKDLLSDGVSQTID